jgi:hypothetical protein
MHGVAEVDLAAGVWQPVRTATMLMIEHIASEDWSFVFMFFGFIY